MPKEKFKLGDQVRLLSGGPVMTISDLPMSPADYYGCTWFAGSKMSRGNFKGDILKPVEAESPTKD